jgi:hypothetical protein
MMLFLAAPHKAAANGPKITALVRRSPRCSNTPVMNSPPPTPLTPTQASLPTIGAVLGSGLGSVLVDKLGLDPVAAGSVIAGCTALATALFHWIGSKLGVPL